jgi:hypothetical protein
MALGTWLRVFSAGVLGLAPSVILAHSDPVSAAAGPALECNYVATHILLEQSSAAWLTCHVTGASSDDSSFSISITDLASGRQLHAPCAAELSLGEGSCLAGLVDPTAQLSVTADLHPSGTTLGTVIPGESAPTPQTEAPMQFFPLGD